VDTFIEIPTIQASITDPNEMRRKDVLKMPIKITSKESTIRQFPSVLLKKQTVGHYKTDETIKPALEKHLSNNDQLNLRLLEASEELKRTHEELLKHKSELEKRNKDLLIAKQAFSILAKDSENGKKEIEKKIAYIVTNKIMPIIMELQKPGKLDKYRPDLEALTTFIKNLIGNSENYNILISLTDTEMRVAVMIKEGLTSAKIANLLYISRETVKTHRKHIRKKLCINKADINLSSYLKSKL
jgi:DNA-binding CsgD family transcriptional regulator